MTLLCCSSGAQIADRAAATVMAHARIKLQWLLTLTERMACHSVRIGRMYHESPKWDEEISRAAQRAIFGRPSEKASVAVLKPRRFDGARRRWPTIPESASGRTHLELPSGSWGFAQKTQGGLC